LEAPARQDARAAADNASIPVMLFMGALVIAGFYVSRLPQEQVLRKLESDPRVFFLASGLFALPVLLFGFFDFSRARQRVYEPPSVRVQIFRSLVYGLLLAVANLAFFVALKPQLVRVLHGYGSRAFYALLLGLPYAILGWYLCFRRRDFTVVELPTFRDAALALRDSYDFILGRTGSDWKTGTGDPRWFILPEKAMYTNLYCLGGIGSGKTSSVVKPLVEQGLFKYPHDAKKKLGIFMLDAKGNNAEYIVERAKAAGRSKDVVILQPGGAYTYNLLGPGTPTQVASKLVAALQVMTEQQSNTYYLKMQREYATHALTVLGDVLGAGQVTIYDLYNFIADPAYAKMILEQAAATDSLSFRWFKTQWSQEDPREQMQLTKGFRADLAQFLGDEIAATFCVSKPTFPGWNDLLDTGKIVVFSMSLDKYGPFARAMGIFVLLDFQNAMLARTTPEFRASGHNTERLILCVADEVWAYMNPGLAQFTSVSREARCCTLALHQSLGQVQPIPMQQVMIGNFRTPIILAINDELSLKTYSSLFGQHDVLRESRSESAGYSGVQKQLLSDGLVGKIGGESRSVSVSQTMMKEPRFSTDDILRLGPNRAVVQMYDGERTHQPCVVETLPGYKPEYQLG